MAAGAARHGARKGSRGIANVLQALGVAGCGLLAVTVLTMLSGGPALPDVDPAEVSTGSSGRPGLPAGSRSPGVVQPGGGGASPESAPLPTTPVGGPAPSRPAASVPGAQGAPGPSASSRTAPTPSPTRTPQGRTVPIPPSQHPVTPTPSPAPSATPTVPTPVHPDVPSPPDWVDPGPPPSG